jgi:hypothetical protein
VHDVMCIMITDDIQLVGIVVQSCSCLVIIMRFHCFLWLGAWMLFVSI